MGALLTSRGRIDAELSRRIGIAASDFMKLQKLWEHSGVSRSQKLQCFEAAVVSRLVYGLATSWLVKTQRRRVDGFYAKCLRRILRIPSAFISRVSNQHVFDAAGVVPVSLQIEQRAI